MAESGYLGWFGNLFAGGGRSRRRRRIGSRFGWRGLFGRASDERLAPPSIKASDAVVRPAEATGRRALHRRNPAEIEAKLRQMRRRAVVDMFDQVGIGPFPGQLWRFVDAENDPYAGVMAFLGAIGVDPHRLRARDPDEVERTNRVLELLFSIDHVFDRVTPEVAAALEACLCSGDYAAVERAATVIQIFEKIARIEARWPVHQRLALLDAFINDARAGIADPLAVPASAAEQAGRIADELVRQMVALDSARAEQARLRSYLAVHWPAVWNVAPEGRQRAAAVSEADHALARLLGETKLRHDEVEALLGRLARANAQLSALATRIERVERGEWSAAPVQAAPDTDFDRALAFFGFASHERPDASLLRQRFRSLARTIHPDLVQGGASAREAAHECFIALNRHYETLKLRL